MIARQAREWGSELTGFGRPFGLGVDRDGRLHVTDMDRHCVIRFDPTLDRHDVIAPGHWNGPHSIDFAADGRAFVTCYYTPGIYVVGDDHPLPIAPPLTGPASSLFDRSGRLLVSEYSKNAVLVVDVSGRIMSRLAGDFDRPHMTRGCEDGSVLVADTWHNRIQKFDADGALITDRLAEMPCPVAIDVDREHGMLVTAWGDNSVLRLDGDGRPAGRLEAPPLEKPYDARWLDGGRVAVADSHHGRVLILDSPRFH